MYRFTSPFTFSNVSIISEALSAPNSLLNISNAISFTLESNNALS